MFQPEVMCARVGWKMIIKKKKKREKKWEKNGDVPEA